MAEKLSRKERKELEAQQAREQKEWDAKFAAKQEKKNIQKMVTELEKTEKEIIASAIDAKSKGYADVYRVQLSALKVARARRTQADKFLYQIDTMEKMKSLADSSKGLLSSMGSIMGTLGSLSLDKNEMAQSQKDFAAAQRNLEQQSMSIEQFFSRMEMNLPEEESDMMDGVSYSFDDLDKEIGNYMANGQSSGANGAAQSTNDEIAQLQSLLGN